MTVRERLAPSGIAYKDPLLDAVDAELAETNARIDALEARARGVESLGPEWARSARAHRIWGTSRAQFHRDVADGIIPEIDPQTGETVWQILRGRRVYSEAWLEKHKGQRRGA